MAWDANDYLYAGLVLAVLAIVHLCYTLGGLLRAIRSRALATEGCNRGVDDGTVVKELLARAMNRVPVARDGSFARLAAPRQFAAIDGLLAFLRGAERRRLLDLAQQLGLDEQVHDRLGSESPAERIAAIHLLDRWPLPRIVREVAVRLASDDSKAVRLEAAAALGRIEQLPRAEEVLGYLELAQVVPNRLHRAVIEGLARAEPETVAAFSFAPSFRSIRAPLIEALGTSGEPGVGSCLVVHACDRDPEVRSAALRSARRLSHSQARSWAARLLDDPVEAVRIQAIRCCAEFGIAEAKGSLARFVDSKSAWERMRAREALASLAAA